MDRASVGPAVPYADIPVAPSASGSSKPSSGRSRTPEPLRSCSSPRHGTHGAPGCKAPQNTSPRPQLVRLGLKMRNFTPRRSDHPTDSAVHFVSGIHILKISLSPRSLAKSFSARSVASFGRQPQFRPRRFQFTSFSCSANGLRPSQSCMVFAMSACPVISSVPSSTARATALRPIQISVIVRRSTLT